MVLRARPWPPASARDPRGARARGRRRPWSMHESSASISRRFSESVCVPVAKSVSQLPIRASRCASLSCSSRRVASACSSAALGDRALALDRGHQQVGDRLDEREVVLGEGVAPAAARHQLAERRRPGPIGAATRLSMPSAASPGASNVGLGGEVGAEQRLAGGRACRRPCGARRGRAPAAARRRLLAGARADRDVAVRGRLEHHDQVARERLVEHPRRLVEQLVDRHAAQGERAEGADRRLLGEAAARARPARAPGR